MAAPGKEVYGLLSEVNDEDLKTILKYEARVNTWTKKYVDEINLNLEKLDGTQVQGVKTYKAVKYLELRGTMPATPEEYLKQIIKSAETYNFPADYIAYLKSTPRARMQTVTTNEMVTFHDYVTITNSIVWSQAGDQGTPWGLKIEHTRAGNTITITRPRLVKHHVEIQIWGTK
jgi:hypothetical protein